MKWIRNLIEQSEINRLKFLTINRLIIVKIRSPNNSVRPIGQSALFGHLLNDIDQCYIGKAWNNMTDWLQKISFLNMMMAAIWWYLHRAFQLPLPNLLILHSGPNVASAVKLS